MMKMSRIVAGMAAASAAAIVLAGCAGDTGGSASPTGGSMDEWDGSAIPSAVISLPAPTQSFDPTASVSATDRVASALMNTSLFLTLPDGTVEPGLAESVEFNEDLTAATVVLREANFSDGSPITAEDVVATFMRHKSVDGSTIASTTDRVESVTAVDESTVEFTFPAPYPSFTGHAGVLAIYPASAMADAEAYFAEPTVTSGQYTIADGWASNRLELETNPEYWGGAPAVENVTFTIIEDANSAISQLQSGQVDFAGDLAPNFITQIQGTEGIEVLMSDVYGFYDVRLQNLHGPFADVNVRKAVNAALDRDQIVTAIWGENNTPQSGFWPEGMEGHDPSKSTARDLDAAQEFLAGTECENGCTVEMMYSDQDFPFSGQLALMVQAQLAEIGIEVELEKLDASTMIDRLFAAEYDLVPGAMASTGNVPDQLLTNALDGEGFLKAEFTGYNSPEMNALIDTVLSTDGEERSAAIAEIEELFSEDQPYATLAPWVRGSASTLPTGAFQLVGATARMESQQ
jgi:peptide/nickel transport system substrate-binding protein